MSDLFKLKQWLTLENATKHLSSIFNEIVNDYDILRFALDGHLILSTNIINGADAKNTVFALLKMYLNTKCLLKKN